MSEGDQEHRVKSRVCLVLPSKMLTRARKGEDDDVDDEITAALKDAGIPDADTMTEDYKKELYATIQVSKKQNQNAPEHSPDFKAQPSINDGIMAGNVGGPNKPAASGQPGSSQTPKTAGRGRGKPIKTKYPSLLTTCTPGQKSDPVLSPPTSCKINTSSDHLGNPMSTLSPTSVLNCESPPPPFHNNCPASTDDTAAGDSSPQSQSFKRNSPDIFSQDSSDNSVGAVGRISQGDDDILVDVEPCGPEETAVCDNEPDSPASVQDAGEDEKVPVKTITIGTTAAQVSPLEAMNRDIPSNGFSNFFQDLEKYRGNKAEWMAKANEKVREHRIALWKQLKQDNPIWGPPIADGGNFNKRTLFKDSTPKYSQLFSSPEKQVGTSTTHGRAERLSKSRAVAKIQEAVSDSLWEDTEFRSLRRSRQNDGRNQGQGSRPPSNPSSSRKPQDVEINVDDCTEDMSSAASSEKWPSIGLEQRGKSSDGDFELPSESSKVSGSSDVYDYPDEDEDTEIWKISQGKNRKNFKKGGNRSIQADAELETKGPQRPKGPGMSQQTHRPKNTKLRLQKGAIAPLRPKGGVSQHLEGETNAQNSANNEGRWLRTDSPGIEDSSGPGISPKTFFPKPGQPRNCTSQTRRSRDNLRPDDISSPPSTSDNMLCPICSQSFSKEEIAPHASDCNGYAEAPAVGENSKSDEDQDSEEKDKAVLELKNTESTKEPRVIHLCKLCGLQFDNQTEWSEHLNKCIETHTMPSKKRANSIDDDGPVKKTRCGE